MARKLETTARQIAERAREFAFPPTWDYLRDFCDSWTYGELECDQLDRLTDLVERELNMTEFERKVMDASEE